VHIWSKYN